MISVLTVSMLAAVFVLPSAPAAPQEAASQDAVVLHVGKILTMNGDDEIVAPGMLVLEGGKITYAGPIVERAELPAPVHALDTWAFPGLVDLHTHIHSGGFGDINDMVNAITRDYCAPEHATGWGDDRPIVTREGKRSATVFTWRMRDNAAF